MPAKYERYASGGYWRLSQALTSIWGKDLKDVLDEEIFSKVVILKERWDWLTGEAVRKDTNFYPLLPGYGRFLDPPFYIDGNPVRGGPGWFVISALDLARLGLLFACNGAWEGAKLVPYIREPDRKSGQDNTNRVAGYGHTKGSLKNNLPFWPNGCGLPGE